MSTFFVRRGSRVSGPIGSSELKRRARQGSLLSSDEISRDREQWILAREIMELEFAAPTSRSQPPPAPPPFADTDTVEAIPEGLQVPVALSSSTISNSPNSDSPVNKSSISSGTPNGKLDACPDCGGPVSLKAIACPHCGCPRQPPAVATIASKLEFSRKVAVLYWLAGTLSAAMVAALLVILAG